MIVQTGSLCLVGRGGLVFIFDAHIDTLLKLAEGGSVNDLAKIDAHVNLPKLRQAGVKGQIFAIFVPTHYYHGLALNKALEMVDVFWQNIERYSQTLVPVLGRDDWEQVLTKQEKIGAILSIEGGEALAGSIANLRNFYRLGVRAVTLTWNGRNALADGVGEGDKAGGLSEFGREVISEMNHLGMLVDVSHIAYQGFWDVIEVSKQPIIASHSNAKQLCQHHRNLTDKQIKAIADRGGVIGVNFCPSFVTDNPEDATIERVVDHIDYLVNIGGVEAVGLGSDFDGIRHTPHGLEDATRLPGIIKLLEQRGYSADIIEKIMGVNFLSLTQQIFIGAHN